MDSRHLLVVVAITIGLVCLALVVRTAVATGSRIRRDRWTQRLTAEQRRYLQEVACGEGEYDGSAGKAAAIAAAQPPGRAS